MDEGVWAVSPIRIEVPVLTEEHEHRKASARRKTERSRYRSVRTLFIEARIIDQKHRHLS